MSEAEKKRIKDEAIEQYGSLPEYSIERVAFKTGAEFGYQLAQEELDKLNHINEALEEAVDVFGEKIDDLSKIDPNQDELWEELDNTCTDANCNLIIEEAKNATA